MTSIGSSSETRAGRFSSGPFTLAPGSAISAHVSARFTDHILRAGINCQFGGLVVAKYLKSTEALNRSKAGSRRALSFLRVMIFEIAGGARASFVCADKQNAKREPLSWCRRAESHAPIAREATTPPWRLEVLRSRRCRSRIP